MNLGDELRAVLNEEAVLLTATRPDVGRLIAGGRVRRRRRNAAWAVGAVLAAVIAGGGVYGVAQLGDHDASSVSPIVDQPTPKALPEAVDPVALEAGTYLVPAGNGTVVSPYTVTVPARWRGAVMHRGIVIGKNQEDASGAGHTRRAIGIEPFVLDRIRLTDDTCTGPETLGNAPTSTAALVAGLRAQGSGPRVSDPVATTVGGLPATRIDLEYPARRPLSSCRLADLTPGLEKGVLQVWSGYFILFPDESASVYVVQVGDRAQMFVTRTADDASAADRAELQSILDSITFQAPTG